MRIWKLMGSNLFPSSQSALACRSKIIIYKKWKNKINDEFEQYSWMWFFSCFSLPYFNCSAKFKPLKSGLLKSFNKTHVHKIFHSEQIYFNLFRRSLAEKKIHSGSIMWLRLSFLRRFGCARGFKLKIWIIFVFI